MFKASILQVGNNTPDCRNSHLFTFLHTTNFTLSKKNNMKKTRKIVAAVFVTADGVMQAPGAPQEDSMNNFSWGGWSANYWDEMMGNTIGESMSQPFDLLLGRRTYEIFAAHWPYIKNDPVADKFNSITKYVVSHKPQSLDWQNSISVNGDIVAEIKKIKNQDGSDLLIQGSSVLIQTLLANDLLDRLDIWTFPVTIGTGKRLFGNGTKPGSLKLTAIKSSTTGVIIATYEPAGELKPGSFAIDPPTDAEVARRKRLAEEDKKS